MKKQLDIATLAGIISGMLLITGAMMAGGGIGMFINVSSMLIVFGGTIAATLVNFPLKEVIKVSQIAVKAFFSTEESPTEMISQLVALTGKAKKEGMLAMEQSVKEIENPLLKTGLGYIVDSMPPEDVKNALTLQQIAIHSRHKAGQDIFKGMGRWAPAFGMIGTLIGLVQMLASMEDPSSIGPAMAVALLTTFYGALLANLVFLPIAGKLARRSDIEMVTMKLVMEGLEALQRGMSPMLVETTLKAFLETQLQGVSLDTGKSDTKSAKGAKAPAAVG